jgi:hypothetical protein
LTRVLLLMAIVLSMLTLLALVLVLLCIPIYVGTVPVAPWVVIVVATALAGCAVTSWVVLRRGIGELHLPVQADEGPPPSRPELLEEYKLAQASAEHHDRLLWSTTGIVWSASLVLLGLVIKDLRAIPESSPRVLLSVLGIALTAGIWWMTSIWNTVMRIKYHRCQELEVTFHFHQHRNVERAYPRGGMTVLYGLISLILLGTWLGVLCASQ